MSFLLIPLFSGSVAISVALFLLLALRKTRVRFPRMAEIASYIALRVRTYLARQFKTILLIAPFLALIIGLFFNLCN